MQGLPYHSLQLKDSCKEGVGTYQHCSLHSSTAHSDDKKVSSMQHSLYHLTVYQQAIRDTSQMKLL